MSGQFGGPMGNRESGTPPWLLLVNPAAGHGRCGRALPELLERVRAADIAFDLRVSSRPGEIQAAAAAAVAAGCRTIAVAGGDGTQFEALNGALAAPSERQEPICFAALPLGTGNSFARDLGIRSTDDAFGAWQHGVARAVDVVAAEHDEGLLHYVNLLSLGFSATVGALTNRRFKPLGSAGYSAAVLSSVVRLQQPSFPLRLDAQPLDTRPCTLLAFCNSRLTGGAMQMAPHARIDDGSLDFVRIGALSRRRLLACFPKIFRGTHLAMPETEHAIVREVELVLDEAVDAMVDGEILRLRLRRLRVLPGAVHFMAAR